MLVFAVSPSLSEAQSRYDNSFPVRVGIFYGSISKSTYSVSGSSLEVYDASNKVIGNGFRHSDGFCLPADIYKLQCRKHF